VSVAKIVWFARGGGIARCGPYPTQVAAVDAMRLADKTRGEFPPDVFVWPEPVPVAKPRRKR